jgi:SAM-dependent MidA family methyltransferase
MPQAAAWNNLVTGTDTELATRLRQQVEREGPMPFARFMDAALYTPGLGYYERGPGQVGRGGDFCTSVSVGPLFGGLLAAQIADWLDAEGGDGPLALVEAGAHDGQLAHDILAALGRRRPDLLDRIHYWLIEPSVQRQNWQRLKLENVASRVGWVAGFDQLPPSGVRGVILSNELLDAFPVHRLGWDARRRRWFEWGVGWQEGRFTWQPLPPDTGGPDWDQALAMAGFDLPDALRAVLPDGYVLEWAPGAAAWWEQAAGALRSGRLLTLDYGFTALELLNPARTTGTLRAYARHQTGADPLANPGEQDLTAHVNFTQIQLAGERAGLQTVGLFTQPEFLSRIAARLLAHEPAWTAHEVRQFQSLTHPDHLGRAFRVLVQKRNAPPA